MMKTTRTVTRRTVKKVLTPEEIAARKAKREAEERLKKKRNKVFAIKVIGVFVAIGFTIWGVYTYMQYKSSRDYLSQAHDFLEQEDYYWASKYADNALYFDPEYAEAFLFRAKMELAPPSNYERCLKEMNTCFKYEDDPTDEMYYLRGVCLYNLGFLEKALVDFNHIEDRTQPYDSLSFYLGTLNQKLERDYKAAIPFYKDFMVDHRNSITTVISLAECYDKIEDYDNAMKYIDIAIEIDKKNIDAHYLRAQVLFKQGKEEEGCGYAYYALYNGEASAQILIDKYCQEPEPDSLEEE